MANNAHTQSSRTVLPRRSNTPNAQQLRSAARQHNPAPHRERIASPQPASLKKVTRTQRAGTNNPRSQKQFNTKRKTVAVTLWMSPRERAELQRVAQQKGLSISQTGRAFVVKMLEQNLYDQHAALLDPIIDKAIGKHMRSYGTRLAVLLVRVAFASEQTRSIVTNILGRHPGVTQPVLTEILNGSSNAAKRNITRKTPQLENIIAEVEQWFAGKESENNG